MLWVNRGAGSGSSANASASQTPSTGPFRANDVVFWAIGQDANSATVSSIACDNGSGSFLQLVNVNATARSLNLWMGYGFSGDPTAVTITCSQAGFCYVRHHLTTDRDWTGWTPAVADAGPNSGTTSGASVGGIFPAVGDIIVAAFVMASTTADSTARTHTNHTYLYNAGGEYTTTATRVEMGFVPEAKTDLVAAEAWTLGASVSWAASQATITPPATLMAAISSAALYKGRLTFALDDAAEA